MNNADKLARRLKEARAAYYGSGESLISDAEFDSLEEELHRLEPEHPYFSSVGFGGEGKKIRHRVPMLSMGKAKKLEDVEKWLLRLNLPEGSVITVQPKVDGLSASLFYQKGQLKYAATRGDGEVGQDVSHILSYMEDIPRELSFTEEPVEIRGELYLPKNTQFDTGGKPLRNNCVGLINRKEDRADVRYVKFLAYQIVWPSAEFSGGNTPPAEDLARFPELASESGKITLLRKQGFTTFETFTAGAAGGPASNPADSPAGSPAGGPADNPADTNTPQRIWLQNIGSIYTRYVEQLRDEWNFETDGLIILVDNNSLHDEIDRRWVVDHHHHYALAFKPPAQSLRTRLEKVVWQVSRQGNLTPVAVFQPIYLGGATLERASLHNAENIRRLKLARGDSILVERANDVIPYVRENPVGKERPDNFTDAALWPDFCPSCGTRVVENGVNLACPNALCRSRVLQSILFWVRQAGVEQVALKTLEALYDAGKLRNVRDLYTLTEKDFDGMEGFGAKKISNFLEQTASAKSMSAVELISRLGIPMVQKKSLARLGITSLNDFRSFNDPSYIIGERIIEWKAEKGNMEFLDELLQVVDIQEELTLKESRGTVCLTGKAPMGRKELTGMLEKRGWSVAGTVTRETVLLVCDNPAGSSTKLKKAREAAIPIRTYADFLKGEGIGAE